MSWLNLQHLWLKIMFLYLKWQQQPSNHNYFVCSNKIFLNVRHFFKFSRISYAQWLFINCRWFCWKSSDNIDKCFWCWSCWWRTCYIKCFFFLTFEWKCEISFHFCFSNIFGLLWVLKCFFRCDTCGDGSASCHTFTNEWLCCKWLQHGDDSFCSKPSANARNNDAQSSLSSRYYKASKSWWWYDRDWSNCAIQHWLSIYLILIIIKFNLSINITYFGE